jgi:hypothetical protein
MHASVVGGAMSRESLVKLDSEACLLQSAPPTVCVMLNEMGPFRFSFAFGGWCVGKGGDDGVTDRC